MWASALAVIREAMAVVPAVRYALGVAGIMAALALGTALLKTPQLALFGAAGMLGLMVLLVIFAAGTRLKSSAIRAPALFLMWAVLVLFVASASMAVTSVFFSVPKSFPDLIRPLFGQAVVDDDALREEASRLLDLFYARRFKELYERFPEEVRAQMSYAAFVSESERQGFQFQAPPVDRRFERVTPGTGFAQVSFVAQFDTINTFRELITFVSRGSRLVPWRIDIWHAAWPTTSTTRIATESTAGAVVSAVKAVPAAETEAFIRNRFEGAFVQLGWHVVVRSTLRTRTDRTCDVATEEEQTRSTVLLRDALGGCRWPPGERLAVFGQIQTVDNDAVAISAVRVLK